MTIESSLGMSPENPADADQSHDDNVEQVEAYLFKEKDLVLKYIHQLDHESLTVSSNALSSMRSILDKYLECPTLLDSSLSIIVETLVLQIKQRLAEAQTEKAITDHTGNHFVALYTVAKVRGYKRVNRFLSHQVDDIHLIWRALTAWRTRHESSIAENQTGDLASNNLNDSIYVPWEPLYVLWHWMGVLSLVPFSSRVVSAEDDILSTLIVTAQHDLEFATGPVQEAAATCLASWLSRPDAASQDHDVLQEFSDWAKLVMVGHTTTTTTTTTPIKGQSLDNNIGSEGSLASKSTNLLLGTLQVVTKVLKHASVSRDILLKQLVQPLWEPLLRLDEQNDGNLLLRRYLVKWWTRTSRAYMGSSRLQAWRYQRGKRRLLDLGEENKDEDEASTPQSNKHHSNSGQQSSLTKTDILFFVPDQVEDAMGRILQALGHSSTVVRWSAAKGVGRVTERLPEQCALDVLDAVLEYFDNPELDNCWHGACLALAEMARKGLLLPSSLPSAVPQIIKAIQYDMRRGNTSVGSNVRDAACYAFWAFARSYSPAVLRDHLDKLAEAVILTSLFDREVNCRRAASAAFQEAVGRQGMASFPNGIFVVTTADSFSLGNRSDAFTSISAKIASLPEYRRPIIRHLYENRLSHWDASIRGLAADALANVASLDEAFIGSTVFPDLLERSLDSQNLFARHGAVLGLAELVRFLGCGSKSLTTILEDTTMHKLVDLVNQIESRRLYRGRGGEIMRIAVCRFVECFALARIPLDVKNQVKMLDAVDASIPHPNEEIQLCACRALQQLLTSYFPVGEKGPSSRLRNRVLEKFVKMIKTTKNPAAARGYTMALGHLPAKLLAPDSMSLESVLHVLARAAHPKAKVDGEGDAETRRNATSALVRIVSTVVRSGDSHHGSDYPLEAPTSLQVSKVVKALYWGMEDYNVDRRGDVGSWVRIAAMDGFTTLVLLCDEIKERALFDSLSGTKIVGLMLKQLTEKLDLVRVHAGKSLQKILVRGENSFPSVLGASKLRDALELQGCSITYSWAEPKAVFRRAIAAATINGEEEASCGGGPTYPYYGPTIAGIIASVGGKAEAPEATAALLEHAKDSKGTPLIPKLAKILLVLFERHLGAGRVTLPLLRTVEKLLSRQCLDEVLEPDDLFAEPLLSLMEKELTNCSDVHRLFALSDVAATMTSALPESSTSMKRNYLRFIMCKMLAHEFPRVRARVAEDMYLAVEENESAFPGHASTVSTLLLETPWGNDFTDHEIASYSGELLRALFPESSESE